MISMAKPLAQLHADWPAAVAALGRATTIQETDDAIAALQGIADEAQCYNRKNLRRVCVTRDNWDREWHEKPVDPLLLWAADVADMPWPNCADHHGVALLCGICAVAGDSPGDQHAAPRRRAGDAEHSAGVCRTQTGTGVARAAGRQAGWPELRALRCEARGATGPRSGFVERAAGSRRIERRALGNGWDPRG
jgi:hypothetical protein